ncbi:hypothetical protein Syun_023678 [Stephania yunnanensis]|uniref:Uncharacterized protein n=1 Tax=Stephania yunnanensis TaxID=152371 RepID=A0AAP0I2E8_9MAGN
MVRSLIGGCGGAQLVTEEPSLSRRNPALQSKMGGLGVGCRVRKSRRERDILRFAISRVLNKTYQNANYPIPGSPATTRRVPALVSTPITVIIRKFLVRIPARIFN